MNRQTGGNLDYWTPTNVNAKFPSPGAPSTTFGSYGSALKYEKADYLKIKDITLGYNLPKSAISHIGLSNVKSLWIDEKLFYIQ